MAMNIQIKETWITALLSGKYTQGRHGLRSPDDRYCCLGVLADIDSGDEWEGISWSRETSPGFKEMVVSWHMGASTEWLPEVMRERLGLSSDEQDTLGEMNDDGKTFPEIAAYIRANL